MVTELRHLLEESVQHPPAEPHDTGAIVRRARTRRRRHRLVAAGSALAVVAVAGAGYGVVRELTGGTGADKVAHTEPVGPVVHPDDAVPGGPGKDVTVFASYLNRHVNSRNGRQLPAGHLRRSGAGQPGDPARPRRRDDRVQPVRAAGSGHRRAALAAGTSRRPLRRRPRALGADGRRGARRHRRVAGPRSRADADRRLRPGHPHLVTLHHRHESFPWQRRRDRPAGACRLRRPAVLRAPGLGRAPVPEHPLVGAARRLRPAAPR